MSIDYIRKTYGLAVKVGQSVKIRPGCGSPMDGFTGQIIRAQGAYLVVRGATWRGNFHPADVLPLT